MKQDYLKEMNLSLGALYSSSSHNNTTLIALTPREYNRLKDNCIHLTGVYSVEGGEDIYYRNVNRLCHEPLVYDVWLTVAEGNGLAWSISLQRSTSFSYSVKSEQLSY